MQTLIDVDRITRKERAKYERVWLEDVYREESPAVRVLGDIVHALAQPSVVGLSGEQKHVAVLDAGCGTGRAARMLTERLGWQVLCVDIANNSQTGEGTTFLASPLHELPQYLGQLMTMDAGYCVDVMEHIPRELVAPSLAALATVVKGPMYFRIALFDDTWGETIGVGDLHPTVETVEWWSERLAHCWADINIRTEKDPHHGGEVLVAVCQ